MDHQTMVRVAASAHDALAAFAAGETDPVAALRALAMEIDRAFDAAGLKMGGGERELADEVRAVLLDQIAILQRQRRGGRVTPCRQAPAGTAASRSAPSPAVRIHVSNSEA